MEDNEMVSPIDWKDIPIHPKLAGLIFSMKKTAQASLSS
jgi:hypothetical protein